MNLKIYRPETIKETLEILAAIKGPRFLLAGGTDLMVQSKDGKIPKSSWVALPAIDELTAIREEAPSSGFPCGSIWIGCCATFRDCIKSSLVTNYIPSLSQACEIAGGPQIRNMGTIGGNIANASPAADSVPPLISAGAEIELASLHGKRVVLLEEFTTAPRKTILQEDEIIIGIKVPKNKNVVGKFMRIGTRTSMAISKVSIAVTLAKDINNNISYLRIALGAVAPTVIRAKQTENFLLENGITKNSIATAGKMIEQEVSPIDDIRSTKEYRRSMCKVLFKRILTDIIYNT